MEYSVQNKVPMCEKNSTNATQGGKNPRKCAYNGISFNQMTSANPKCFQNNVVESNGGLTYTLVMGKSSINIHTYQYFWVWKVQIRKKKY